MKYPSMIVAACLPLSACSEVPATGDQAAGGLSALDACKRWDVQDTVGKEARSVILKHALPQLMVHAMFGLVDLDAFARGMENANVSVSDVALQQAAGGSLSSIPCTANFKFDTSSATAGQDVMQIKRLRWTIMFADDRPDIRSGNFTVTVDADSLYENMALNGEPVARIVEREAQEKAAREDRTQAAEAERSSSADEGQVASATHSEPDPTPSTPPPSEDDLYAPH